MKYVISVVTFVIGVIVLWFSTAYRDVDELKIKAPKFISQRGYNITSYDGYSGEPFHGGLVWYQARDNNGYLYQMAVGEWGGELMIYNLKCLNAVENTQHR